MITNEKRYQVFISSTYEDLKEERKEVTEALLQLNCIPCGMEAFPAADDTQWEFIKKLIDTCDYYIVIVAGKFGAIHPEIGKSYTRMEYEYALEKGIPVLGFLVADESKLSQDKIEIEEDKRKGLVEFKSLVKSKLCMFYSNKDDLRAKVIVSITNARDRYPRAGWIRADSMEKSFTSNDEVLTLLKENESLKKQLEHFQGKRNIRIENLAFGEEEYELTFKWGYTNGYLNPFSRGNGKIGITWNTLFYELGVLMIMDELDIRTSRVLQNYIRDNYKKELDEANEISDKYSDFYYDIEVKSRDYLTICIQFKALGYFELNKNGKWKLTSKGMDYIFSVRTIKSKKKKKAL